jgi:hypothetical protein
MSINNTATVGLVELPELGLIDPGSKNRASGRKGSVLISKQVLLADLQAKGFDAQLINLKRGDDEVEYGKVNWGDCELTKVYQGRKITDLDPQAYDVWGLTNNFSQYRELTAMTIKHLASQGKPVVVGGSDAFAEPNFYLQAGARAVVLDQSGATNAAVIDYVLGQTPRTELSEVLLANGQMFPRKLPALSPEDWALPSLEVVKQCLGDDYWSAEYPQELLYIGSVFTDVGCDRQCDFCQTPKYRLGYRAMSPKRALQWFAAQQEAGAGSVLGSSDQFLGRILKKGGRDEILYIMQGLRELALPILWPNGLELKKVTLGRGINRGSQDLTPDEELINALWGWDGKNGCFHAYIPAERPVFGRENYQKLLPWREHCEVLKAIVRTGLPNLTYGVIIGFADESEESLLRLEEAIETLFAELSSINPKLKMQVAPFAISPIPGTVQWKQLHESGLVEFTDPVLLGNLWTPSINSHYLSYKDIARWQIRLLQLGSAKGRTHFFDTDFSDMAA